MKNSQEMYIALPKGRVMREAIPILEEVGIIPEKSFFDNNTRVLKFSTNKKNIKIIKVRSFDVATFLIYGDGSKKEGI